MKVKQAKFGPFVLSAPLLQDQAFIFTDDPSLFIFLDTLLQCMLCHVVVLPKQRPYGVYIFH